MMIRLVDRAVEKYAAYSKEIFDFSRREKDFVAFYDEEFTETELDGLVAFYKTAAGRALIRAQPALMARMQKSAFQKQGETAARIDRIMKESVTEVEQELKKEGKL